MLRIGVWAAEEGHARRCGPAFDHIGPYPAVSQEVGSAARAAVQDDERGGRRLLVGRRQQARQHPVGGILHWHLDLGVEDLYVVTLDLPAPPPDRGHSPPAPVPQCPSPSPALPPPPLPSASF